MSDYLQMVARKLAAVPPSGIASTITMPAFMFPHQAALAQWSLRRGRSAVFADTGLGKMLIELVWAHEVCKHTRKPVLGACPLAVAAQIAAEGKRFGIEVTVCREPSDVDPGGINVTNYDRLHKFDLSIFGGVFLDESSVIKHHDTRTFSALSVAFKDTPFKLCATATPAPNDWTELGTHAEFLGICTRQEMLAEYFTHDGGDTSVWRLKGHARSVFWRWVSTWGAMIRRPSDLGFDDSAYNLPPLHLHEHTVETEMATNGMLFAMEAQSLSERRDARRSSMADRVADCVSTVHEEWAKLAAHNIEDVRHGLEEGICGSPEAEGVSQPGVQGEAKRAVGQGQGCAQGVHARVLRGEPGEVQADPGSDGGSESGAARQVRAKHRVSGEAQGIGGCVAASEPGEAEVSEAQGVRDLPVGFQRHDGDARRALRNLRLLGLGGQEPVPASGPLPQDRKGSRAAVHELQSGAWQVQGQRRGADDSGGLPGKAWLIWCDLNAEQDALEKAFGPLAFSVRGSDSADDKEAAIQAWLRGERPVMISKPSIMGWGLNFQHCDRMAFVGVTDSFEAFYQAIRRCWRFGQKREVHAHIFASEAEGAVVANLRRKERDALAMAESLSAETRDAVMQSVTGSARHTNTYNPARRVAVPSWMTAA